MNLLDLGILILLGLIALRGYYRGLFQELAVLVGVLAGVVVAAHTYLRLAELLQNWITDPFHARWIAFVLVLVVVYWLTRLLAHLLQRILYHLYLDLFDRVLGGAFALAKGALLVGFGLIVLGAALKHSQMLKDSRATPYLTHFARQSLELLPPDFKQRLTDYLQQWRKDQRQAQNVVPEEEQEPQADRLPPQRPTKDWQTQAADELQRLIQSFSHRSSKP